MGSGSKLLCISVFMFLKVSRQILAFWSTGRQIHNSWSYVFLCFFMYLCLPMDPLTTISLPCGDQEEDEYILLTANHPCPSRADELE